MPHSILEALKLGLWDFGPRAADADEFEASEAMPGTREKLDVLVEHMRRGMPYLDDCRPMARQPEWPGRPW